MKPKRHLVIFVKAPRVGAVKTRLASDIGAVAAWGLYRRMAAAVIRRLCRDRRWTSWLAVTPDRYARRGRFWPQHVQRLSQGHGDLGARMARVARELPRGSVVIVGSDVPDLAAPHVAAAFRALAGADAAFGPTPDGGYWLLGFGRRRPWVDPFSNVRWSSRHALADTLANLPAHWRVAQLAKLTDIDDSTDLARWRASNGSK